MGKLDNKVAIVTGGARGIGAASAQALADEGADVAISYSSSADQAKAVVADLEAKGVRAAAFRADQADATQAADLIRSVVEQFGKLDILVNNAAVSGGGLVGSELVDHATIERQLAVNYTSVVAAIQAAVPFLPDGGRIVNISSGVATRAGFQGMAYYTGTKAALEGFSRGAARDLAHRDITVNVVQPGFIDTDGNPADGPAASMFLPTAAMGRYGRPEEIAAGVVFLASPQASYVTGAILRIDGGYSA
ncbi:SDR family oxidoreductase [Amycolatopsis endophytica]|uniref:NAD(P)-dependent dehydrogenase (Short-subunit alcohol dehydrogenase family) n=1 Tax=Amycolatopsis endophytica TaxID=860233 RepID=A0A853B609_9PSEU|nr:SDR family oxidoreductase [Amycolatopsis endophytica]NYI89986.1 NAD(P)-dependent dehydrogenase (short-subunit alcohol dehydrogenase family) [Amycolatopsis endophytica]